jgi:ABC-2 type transport system permease protein
MNIIRFEFRRNLRSFLIWTAAILAFCVWMLSVYESSFSGLGAGINKFVQYFPESMKKAFGIDRLDITTITGYFGMEVHLFIILFGSMYSALQSSGLLSKEESEKTVEFLLSRPITRTSVVTQKLAVYVIYVTLFSVITWSVSYAAMLRSTSSFDKAAFWMLGGMTYLAILAIASLGFLGSVFVTRHRTVYSAALGLVLGLYALQIVADISERTSFLRYITPFKWASAADILPRGSVDPVYVVLAAGVILGSVAGAYRVYSKKDIAI